VQFALQLKYKYFLYYLSCVFFLCRKRVWHIFFVVVVEKKRKKEKKKLINEHNKRVFISSRIRKEDYKEK